MDTQSVCLSIHLCRSVCVIGWIRSVDPSLPTALPLSRGQWADRSLARAILKRLAHRQTHTHSVSRSLLCVCLSVCLCLCLCVLTRHSHTVSVSVSLCCCVCSFVRESIPPPDSTPSVSLRDSFSFQITHTVCLSCVCVDARGERDPFLCHRSSANLLSLCGVIGRIGLTLTPRSSSGWHSLTPSSISNTLSLICVCVCSYLIMYVWTSPPVLCVCVCVHSINQSINR